MNHLILPMIVNKWSFFFSSKSKDVDSSFGEADQLFGHTEEYGRDTGLPQLKGLVLKECVFA